MNEREAAIENYNSEKQERACMGAAAAVPGRTRTLGVDGLPVLEAPPLVDAAVDKTPWKWGRSTTEQSEEGIRFDAFFEKHRKQMKGVAEAENQAYDYFYLHCLENESIEIPPNSHVAAAYFGDPTNYARGCDVTAKVVEKVRSTNVIWARVQWLGDPWFGSEKGLHVKVATPKYFVRSQVAQVLEKQAGI